MTIKTMTIDFEDGNIDMAGLLTWLWAENKRYELVPIFHQGSKQCNLGGISGYTLYYETTDKASIEAKIYESK